MSPAKRHQSNTMLYTVVVFVGISIVAATAAVIYYVKAEEYRTHIEELDRQTDELATKDEVRRLGTIVGTKLPGQSRLAAMVDYLDKLVAMLAGPVSPNTAEVKLANAASDVAKTIRQVEPYIGVVADPNDPNSPGRLGLLQVVGRLHTKLTNTIAEKDAVQQQLDTLQKDFDNAMAETREKERTLLAEKQKLEQDVNDAKRGFEELKALVQQSSQEQVKALMARLDEERANARKLNDELLKTQAELSMVQERMKVAVERIREIQAPPDREAAAYQPDGKIILVDETGGLVRLDIGAENHVYRGLTFSVYDKARVIPKDGKPKAEIEVFAVTERTSVARIVSSERTNPIAVDDLAANLVWDSKKANRFVVTGEFDLNGDGTVEYDAIDRIKTLIAKWGGTTSDAISTDTDFVILGDEPAVPPRPTLDDLQVDPTAREKYDAAVQRREAYQTIQSQAQALWIPIFTYERFLYFIGYKGLMAKPGAL